MNYGFKVTLKMRPPYSPVTVLRNVTEIHYNYPSPLSYVRIAFESDIQHTGITYDASDVIEYEAVLETEVYVPAVISDETHPVNCDTGTGDGISGPA